MTVFVQVLDEHAMFKVDFEVCLRVFFKLVVDNVRAD